ncbi:MAG TPA: heme-binding protein [Chloroflexota bacterium]|nr:heme-binding protein [Chloroflexota bacterium]
MFERLSLGLNDAQRAISAALAEAERDGKPMAVAVVDANGDLISCARMDGAHERILRMAIRKAYTAATMERDTVAFKDDIAEHARSLDDYGDALFTTLQGGMPVRFESKVVGAVAVGGNTPDRDKGIAEVAAKAVASGLER